MKKEEFISRLKVKTELLEIKSINRALAKEIQLLRKQLLITDVTGKELKLNKKVNIKKDKRKKNEVIPIALLSDGHIEERVDKESVNGFNEYNPDIAEIRINNFFTNTLELINIERNNSNIDTIVLGLLGDMISGYIHEELMENNYLSPVEAILLAQRLLSNGIKYLSENGDFKKIIVVCKVGNHSRLSRKKKFATGYKNSLEYIMYHNIIKDIANTSYNNVEFIFEENEFTYITVFDKVISFSHGDHFNYRGGIGGLEIPFKTWIFKQNANIKADLRCIGHWHTHAVTDGGIINSSVIGFNAFALGLGFKYQPPTQHMQLLDKKRGFTTNYKIFLD